jgi:SAM-dependent methyltransferase
MKGYVPTPRETVDAMVALLFRGAAPGPQDAVLDPGCGTGQFIDGVIRWCKREGRSLPRITGVESDPRHLPALRAKFQNLDAVRIEHADFLADHRGSYRFIVGNPPYVAITALSEAEKAAYRKRFATATGRFDLYLLFFEQAIQSLAPGGRLVLITPEKYLYVDTAAPLRSMLASRNVEEIRLVPEDTFGKLVTYPTITVLRNEGPGETRVAHRDGRTTTIHIPPGSGSWLPLVECGEPEASAVTLGDVCTRISCGVATGADGVFVHRADTLESGLRRFAFPTIAGRQLTPETTELPERFAMLIPYDEYGRLLPLDGLGALRGYLMRDDVRRRLLARTCVARKPWYAFHETPMLREILRPKILCKDIGATPRFWIDRGGEFVPRHSVYYLVPKMPGAIDAIAAYLRSPRAARWIAQNCQRASKGFVRLQSRVLKRMPLPDEVVRAATESEAQWVAGIARRQSDLAFMK